MAISAARAGREVAHREALRGREKIAARPEVSETADFILPIGAGTMLEPAAGSPVYGPEARPAAALRGTSLALNTVLRIRLRATNDC